MSSPSFSSDDAEIWNQDAEFWNLDASPKSPLTTRSQVSNPSLGTVQSPVFISSSTDTASLETQFSSTPEDRLPSPPYWVDSRLQNAKETWKQTRARLVGKSEKLIAENGALRQRLRLARVKVPLDKGEGMFHNSRRDSLDTLRDASYRLQDENERMVLREKRYDWYARNPHFQGTTEKVRSVLYDLDLLSPYDLTDGDEPLDEP